MAFLLIFNRLGGDKIAAGAPRNLNNKLLFLRRAAKQLPKLVSLKAPILLLVAHTEAEADNRHDIVHGVAFHHPAGAAEVKMARLLRKANIAVAKPFETNTIEILILANRANQLTSESFRLCEALSALLARM